MRKSKKPSTIREVRAYYGMTQQALADHLQVTRTHLSMTELGQRDLPTAAHNAVQRLHMAMANAGVPHLEKALKNVGKNQKDTAIAEAKYKLHKHHYNLSRAEKALAKLQSAHSRATHILASLEALKKDASPAESHLFGVLANEAAELYNSSGENTWLNLELRMEAMKAETAYIKTKFKDSLDK